LPGEEAAEAGAPAVRERCSGSAEVASSEESALGRAAPQAAVVIPVDAGAV